MMIDINCKTVLLLRYRCSLLKEKNAPTEKNDIKSESCF